MSSSADAFTQDSKWTALSIANIVCVYGKYRVPPAIKSIIHEGCELISIRAYGSGSIQLCMIFLRPFTCMNRHRYTRR